MQECQEDYAAALSFLSNGHVLPRKVYSGRVQRFV